MFLNEIEILNKPVGSKLALSLGSANVWYPVRAVYQDEALKVLLKRNVGPENGQLLLNG